MGADLMGRVTVEATVESLEDLWAAEQGMIPPDEIRRVVISDALVDSGATLLSLPRRHIERLGLRKSYEKPGMSAAGAITAEVYQTVRLSVQGRHCNIDVAALPDEAPALIGQVPLEIMDWVIDMKGRGLIGNPAHGGEWVIEMY